MAGYDKRKSLAKGVHDELYVKCLVFKEEEMFVLFSLDLLGVDSKFVDEVKKQIKSLENVPTEYILVCATHTHSGPSEIFWGKDNFNPEYWNFVVSQCKNSFEEALNDLKESALWYGKKEIYGIG
ncbi:neutral/alkaline non-lysosomal ceramidase N-terminal domain-containing protein, partial [Pseudothermotoga lettingae]|uniref:neutral/alkaline non-lysosomal ceramidase N-terminal domain-containing protein n=1 Tax=Pseudothermotoga lettingae TaxID=177758 RepID=UPI0023A8CFC8